MTQRSDRPRPLIGVTIGTRQSSRVPPRMAAKAAYVDALQSAGADVVLLPAGTGAVAPALLDLVDGLVLTGGVDVNPARYGESPRPGLGMVDDALDALELPLVGTAMERRIPLFGICRGHQVVNVALGGTLYQDLACDGATSFPHATPLEKGRDHLAHEIDVAAGSRLSDLLGPGRVAVNSFHHQAVRRLAPGLVVTAESHDGVVEGMESEDGLILTVQCHPEELTALDWAQSLFGALVAAASAR